MSPDTLLVYVGFAVLCGAVPSAHLLPSLPHHSELKKSSEHSFTKQSHQVSWHAAGEAWGWVRTTFHLFSHWDVYFCNVFVQFLAHSSAGWLCFISVFAVCGHLSPHSSSLCLWAVSQWRPRWYGGMGGRMGTRYLLTTLALSATPFSSSLHPSSSLLLTLPLLLLRYVFVLFNLH